MTIMWLYLLGGLFLGSAAALRLYEVRRARHAQKREQQAGPDWSKFSYDPLREAGEGATATFGSAGLPKGYRAEGEAEELLLLLGFLGSE